jgi:hypothetical protein
MIAIVVGKGTGSVEEEEKGIQEGGGGCFKMVKQMRGSFLLVIVTNDSCHHRWEIRLNLLHPLCETETNVLDALYIGYRHGWMDHVPLSTKARFRHQA